MSRIFYISKHQDEIYAGFYLNQKRTDSQICPINRMILPVSVLLFFIRRLLRLKASHLKAAFFSHFDTFMLQTRPSPSTALHSSSTAPAPGGSRH